MENLTGDVSEKEQENACSYRNEEMFTVAFRKTPVNYHEKRVKSSSL